MATQERDTGNYLVAYELSSTNDRRVSLILKFVSLIVIFLGIGWAIYFGIDGNIVLVIAELALATSGILSGLLARRGKLRTASIILFSSVYIDFFAFCGIYDIPNAIVPRCMHMYFLLMMAASHLLFRREAAVVRHGITVACFAAFVYFASTTTALIPGYALPDDVRITGTWVNNISVFAILYLVMNTFIGDVTKMESYLHGANNRFVGLVRGMFPQSIAERLLTSGHSFAERHQNCSVLFADIVNFTRLTEQMQPDELVGKLSAIFSKFDALVELHGLTKIKTIGDAFMVASGVPEPRPDHAAVLIQFGKDILEVTKGFDDIELRIGIASGELVAGVIGNSRQVYDVWGDAVNMASRMESHGLAGRIQVSASTQELVTGQFSFECRHGVSIKGKAGLHDVFVLSA
jgi:class 3 adenylate cyclase